MRENDISEFQKRQNDQTHSDFDNHLATKISLSSGCPTTIIYVSKTPPPVILLLSKNLEIRGPLLTPYRFTVVRRPNNTDSLVAKW